MALKAQFDQDIKAALLGGDRFTASVLRDFKAAVLNEEVAQKKRDEGLSDEEIEKVLIREVKKRAESAAIYDGAERTELAQNERAESNILEKYLPEQVSEADIKAAVDEAIVSTGATSAVHMGQVIGAVKSQLGNAADGATIARIVKEALR
ncbi:MAG: GatB/YqeY [Candidatus Microsaccharimonas sossegonensis]|uniref:GatB/YqeY n=1 Tax=Candidatus Microsaccharimonas sossegonensis TaxID=2506948 RepID=A0A4Q0AHG0_9BACT|nr:MAG: GatB/YqeY [Candidatus Microsaccharimonas sossegonensis]